MNKCMAISGCGAFSTHCACNSKYQLWPVPCLIVVTWEHQCTRPAVLKLFTTSLRPTSSLAVIISCPRMPFSFQVASRNASPQGFLGHNMANEVGCALVLPRSHKTFWGTAWPRMPCSFQEASTPWPTKNLDATHSLKTIKHKQTFVVCRSFSFQGVKECCKAVKVHCSMHIHHLTNIFPHRVMHLLTAQRLMEPLHFT